MRWNPFKHVSAFLFQILSHTQFVRIPVCLCSSEEAAVCTVNAVQILLRQNALHTAQCQLDTVAVQGGLLFCQYYQFIFMGIGIAMCTRTERINIFANISKNKAFAVIMPAVAAVQLLIIYFGGDVFRCVPLAPAELLMCSVFAFTVIPADSIRKSVRAIAVRSK